jgi:Methyltransferase domain
MDWKLKALAFQIFDKAPMGNVTHYFMQRYITKRLPRKLDPINQSSLNFQTHIKTFKKQLGSISKSIYFEFGAGWDLYSNLIMYCYGIQHQIVVDVKPLVKPYLVNLVIEKLKKELPEGAIRKPDRLLDRQNFLEALKKFYGIDYRGNSDARCLALPDGSIDLIATTNTLEHIPYETLKSILKECYRLCHQDSVVSMKIDYSDHYSHSDKSLSPYNFLTFSDRAWSKFNSAIHYQNRLRHSDYKKLFLEVGFQIVSEQTKKTENAEENLSKLTLDSRFQNYAPDDLCKTSGYFVLKK